MRCLADTLEGPGSTVKVVPSSALLKNSRIPLAACSKAGLSPYCRVSDSLQELYRYGHMQSFGHGEEVRQPSC